MRSVLIIFPPPGLAELFGVVDRLEPVHIQELVLQRSVERRDLCIVRRCSRSREVHFDRISISPEIDNRSCKLRTVIAKLSFWIAA